MVLWRMVPVILRDSLIKLVSSIIWLAPTVHGSPTNDTFAAAKDLGPIPVHENVSCTGATLEPGEPPPFAWPDQASTWFKWTSPITGWVRIHSTGDSFAHAIAAFTGTNLNILIRVAEATNFGGANRKMYLEVTAGTTYHLAIYTRGGTGEELALHIMPDRGGSFAGFVLDAVGVTPVADTCVTAELRDSSGGDWQIIESSKTRDDGSYIIPCLPPGTYRLLASQSDALSHAPVYYGGTHDADGAVGVPVAAMEARTGLDFRMSPTAAISGRITSAIDGAAISSVWVSSFRWNAPQGTWDVSRGTASSADGTYEITGLATGTYRLKFQPSIFEAYTNKHAFAFSGGNPNIETASDIILVPGASATGIDVALARAARFSTNPLEGSRLDQHIYLHAYRLNEATLAWDHVAAGIGGMFGSALVDGLPSGLYKLRVVDTSGHSVPVWYSNASNIQDAVTYELAAGELYPLPGIILVPAGVIEGAVAESNGKELIQGVRVEALRMNPAGTAWEIQETVSTDYNGDYKIGGLPPDQYRLRFIPPTDAHLPQFHETPELVLAAGSNVSAGTTMLERTQPWLAPVLSSYHRAADGVCSFTFAGTDGESYIFEQSEDLKNWHAVGRIFACGPDEVSLWDHSLRPMLFWRVRPVLPSKSYPGGFVIWQ